MSYANFKYKNQFGFAVVCPYRQTITSISPNIKKVCMIFSQKLDFFQAISLQVFLRVDFEFFESIFVNFFFNFFVKTTKNIYVLDTQYCSFFVKFLTSGKNKELGYTV